MRRCGTAQPTRMMLCACVCVCVLSPFRPRLARTSCSPVHMRLPYRSFRSGMMPNADDASHVVGPPHRRIGGAKQEGERERTV